MDRFAAVYMCTRITFCVIAFALQDFVQSLLRVVPTERLGCGEPGSSLSYEAMANHAFLQSRAEDADTSSFIPPLFEVDPSSLYDGAVIDVDMLGDTELLARARSPPSRYWYCSMRKHVGMHALYTCVNECL